ncbi:hypothetical protein BD289DRAFT_109610 [Coniella lustricola]|uniref:Uncharacterized protein n=1 Tax=Coniella lustricola TaxID=2025994 RepID=A0A2T2ZXH9_9PEZI|nr:hypothetical protein BD289DRAFT_109610 [Coniella lustricola]
MHSQIASYTRWVVSQQSGHDGALFFAGQGSYYVLPARAVDAFLLFPREKPALPTDSRGQRAASRRETHLRPPDRDCWRGPAGMYAFAASRQPTEPSIANITNSRHHPPPHSFAPTHHSKQPSQLGSWRELALVSRSTDWQSPNLVDRQTPTEANNNLLPPAQRGCRRMSVAILKNTQAHPPRASCWAQRVERWTRSRREPPRNLQKSRHCTMYCLTAHQTWCFSGHCLEHCPGLHERKQCSKNSLCSTQRTDNHHGHHHDRLQNLG